MENKLTIWKIVLLPLFFMNITSSANTWEFLGVSIGKLFYYIIIIITTSIVMNTPYRKIGIFFLVMSFLFLFLDLITQSTLADGLKIASLGVLFLLAGANIYGENPDLLYKQLIFFFALCIPVMICQIVGVSSLFMMWNTDYAHSLDVLDVSELGTFKVIPVYPTLFVGLDELNYQIGQGRPSGLLHSNNILSIFVAIGFGLNLITTKSKKLRYSDLIIIFITTLTMSLMVYTSAFFLVFYCFFFKGPSFRSKLLKLLIVFLLFLCFYYLFFPGIFLSNFGESKLIMSFLLRGVDLANSLGFSGINDLYSDQILLIGEAYSEEGTYSQVSQILKSQFAIPILIVLANLIVIYFRGFYLFRNLTGLSTFEFNIVLFSCLYSQFAIAYLIAPSYQFILGFAFYPLFKKYWIGKYNFTS